MCSSAESSLSRSDISTYEVSHNNHTSNSVCRVERVSIADGIAFRAIPDKWLKQTRSLLLTSQVYRGHGICLFPPPARSPHSVLMTNHNSAGAKYLSSFPANQSTHLSLNTDRIRVFGVGRNIYLCSLYIRIHVGVTVCAAASLHRAKEHRNSHGDGLGERRRCRSCGGALEPGASGSHAPPGGRP